MTAYRYVRSAVSTALEEVPGSIGIAAAGLATAAIGIEAFRSVRFEDLPAEAIRQLRTDGTRGELRSLEEARQIFEQDIPAEAKGSVDGVEAISNDPTIDWMHEQPHACRRRQQRRRQRRLRTRGPEPVHRRSRHDELRDRGGPGTHPRGGGTGDAGGDG
ncbi:hypothetical protein [Vulcanococcus limneticus]|uniref:hypothetical protein n=1 Tax=Vulcanococcus limneticus TaxID=2170428 RepID=UPI00398BD7B2